MSINIYQQTYVKNGRDPVVYIANDEEDTNRFVGKLAHEYNYGRLRHWTHYDETTGQTKLMYDCGPITVYFYAPTQEKETETDDH